MTVMLLGLALVIVAAVAAATLVSGIGHLPVSVRAAGPHEAPDPQAAERTVVGEPHSPPSVLPALTATITRLLWAALAAALGAALAVWGLCGVLAARRPSPGDATDDDDRAPQ